MTSEADRIRERYARRAAKAHLYSGRSPYVRESRSEWEDAVRGWARDTYRGNFADARVMDVGCGHGENLQFMIELGCRPASLFGCELIDDRAAGARSNLPPECRIIGGD